MQRTTAVLIAVLMMAGAGGLYLFSQHSLSPEGQDPPAPPIEKEYAKDMVITHSYKQDNQAWLGDCYVSITYWMAYEYRANDGSAISTDDPDFYGETNQITASQDWTFHIATLKITPDEDFVFDVEKIRMVLFIKQDVLFGPYTYLVTPAYPTDILAGDEVTVKLYFVYPNVISGITLYYDGAEIEYVPDT